MILTSVALLNENPDPTEDEIRDALRGNLCRCTGYAKIINAVMVCAGIWALMCIFHVKDRGQRQ